MTLIGAILKKVQSKDSVTKKYTSPPPEIDEFIFKKKQRKRVNKYANVHAVVDTSPPRFEARRMSLALPQWKRRMNDVFYENIRIVCAVTKAYMSGGKVDSHWTAKPLHTNNQFYDNRIYKYKIIKQQNKYIYKRIMNTAPRVVPTARLEVDWNRKKHEIIQLARKQFILFPITSSEIMEDRAFVAPDEVKRPRVSITLRMRNAAVLGTLVAELFTDICPEACRLFLELLDGNGLGHGYVGTRFFRKVPDLFWSGGDVIYDNGFGCYAQKHRLRPIMAENYHFSHSMPGLMSMRVSTDEMVCGIFNITFKALPQFDLKNVVFGRIIRPCSTYETIRGLGSPLSSQPVIEIVATKRWNDGRWIIGSPNTKLRY